MTAAVGDMETNDGGETGSSHEKRPLRATSPAGPDMPIGAWPEAGYRSRILRAKTARFRIGEYLIVRFWLRRDAYFKLIIVAFPICLKFHDCKFCKL